MSNFIFYIKREWKNGQWRIPDSFIIIAKNSEMAFKMLLELDYIIDYNEIKEIKELGISKLDSQIITMNYIFW